MSDFNDQFRNFGPDLGATDPEEGTGNVREEVLGGQDRPGGVRNIVTPFERRILQYNAPPILPCDDATHWIYVINEDYNFFQRKECVILYSDFPYLPHETVTLMKHKTEVRVLDANIGRRGEFNRVEVLDENCNVVYTGIVHGSNLRPLVEQQLPVSLQRCKTGRDINFEPHLYSGITKENWYDSVEPFYEPRACKYYININTTSLTTAARTQRQEEARRLGIRLLFDFYNKDFSVLQDERYSSPLFAQVDAWYMDPNRRDSNMQFLVGIPAIYFDAISEAQILAPDVEGEENGIARVVTFDTSKIRQQIKQLTGLFEDFERDMSWRKYKHRYTGPAASGLGIINFSKEAERLNTFFAVVQRIMRLNDYPLREDVPHKLEIGLSIDFKIRYIFYDDGTGAVNLQRAVNFYNRREPFTLARTCAYMFYSFLILENEDTEERDMTGWKKVIKTYTFPTPDLEHSSNKCRGSFADSLSCLADPIVEGFESARDRVEDKFKRLQRRPGAVLKTEDFRDFAGEADNFESSFSAAKTIKAVKREAAQALDAQKKLDQKIDFHYDGIAEGFPEYLIRLIGDYEASFSGNNLPEANVLLSDLILKFPSPIQLMITKHAATCMDLDKTRTFFEEPGPYQDAEAAQAIRASQLALKCDDVCQAVPAACSYPWKVEFPPRVSLPEVKTVDIMAAFISEFEQQVKQAIIKGVMTASKNMLVDFTFKDNNFVMEDFDLRKSFADQISLSIDESRIEQALNDANINIFNASGDFDEVVPEDSVPEIPRNQLQSPGAGDRLAPYVPGRDENELRIDFGFGEDQ